jgi:hypothetical protein
MNEPGSNWMKKCWIWPGKPILNMNYSIRLLYLVMSVVYLAYTSVIWYARIKSKISQNNALITIRQLWKIGSPTFNFSYFIFSSSLSFSFVLSHCMYIMLKCFHCFCLRLSLSIFLQKSFFFIMTSGPFFQLWLAVPFFLLWLAVPFSDYD